MMNLITDRTQQNVARLKALSAKGWAGMTLQERAEWLGDPMATEGANLLPPGPYYSSVIDGKHRNREIILTSTTEGIYLYAVCIVGDAVKFASKTLTLSVGNMSATNGGTPQIAAYWHDENGFEYAGVSLSAPGSATFNTADFPNTAGRKSLALYMYVTTEKSVSVGTVARFWDVMLEIGSTHHNYTPYTEIIATDATKGAYNYSDLNRVERAVAEISDIKGVGLITKTDWTMWDIPTDSDMNRYLSNIKILRDLFGIEFSLPDSMANMTYETANNIEKIILAAYEKVGGN